MGYTAQFRTTYRDYYAHCWQVVSTLDSVQAFSRLDRTSYELRISPGGFTLSVAIRVHSFLRFFISFSCRNDTCSCGNVIRRVVM